MNEKTIASDKQGSANNNLNESSDYDLSWQWTNTATYAKTFNNDHNMTIVLGTEAMKFNIGRTMGAQRFDYPFSGSQIRGCLITDLLPNNPIADIYTAKPRCLACSDEEIILIKENT